MRFLMFLVATAIVFEFIAIATPAVVVGGIAYIIYSARN